MVKSQEDPLRPQGGISESTVNASNSALPAPGLQRGNGHPAAGKDPMTKVEQHTMHPSPSFQHQPSQGHAPQYMQTAHYGPPQHQQMTMPQPMYQQMPPQHQMTASMGRHSMHMGGQPIYTQPGNPVMMQGGPGQAYGHPGPHRGPLPPQQRQLPGQPRFKGEEFEEDFEDGEDDGALEAKKRKLTHDTTGVVVGKSKHSTANQPYVSQWLMDNYEPAEGVSLPRKLLYQHYQDFCSESNLEPVNPASFGKHIRSVFIGLKTRRLGTRGNSKYHYYGIKVRDSSPLRDYYLTNEDDPADDDRTGAGAGPSVKDEDGVDAVVAKLPYNSGEQAVLPPFPNFDFSDLNPELMGEKVDVFIKSYRVFSERMLVAVHRHQFTEVEGLLEFFKTLPEPAVALVKEPVIVKALVECDQIVYDTILEYLLSNVLDPLPTTLTQSIRHFAKHLSSWLEEALKGQAEAFIKGKVDAARVFAQCLRRRTSLNHLAQAARQVLVKDTQIQQMLTDWLKVDFTGIYDQARWICDCETSKLETLRQEFTQKLKERSVLESWVQWLQTLVDNNLDDRSAETRATSARQFLLKWSFFSSLVIRDLTLRSASSFGSFHLMRLLYDEYVVYFLEKKMSQRKKGELTKAITVDATKNVAEPAAVRDDTPKGTENEGAGSQLGESEKESAKTTENGESVAKTTENESATQTIGNEEDGDGKAILAEQPSAKELPKEGEAMKE